MVIKYEVNDVVLYNSQGTLDVGIIVKIIIIKDQVLYELNRECTILEDNIIQWCGNAEVMQDLYLDSISEMAVDRQSHD